MALKKDIVFNDYFFTFCKYTDEQEVTCDGWFLNFTTDVKLEGDYGPFANREEVFSIVSFIESKMVEARKEFKEKKEDDDIEDRMKEFLRTAMDILAPFNAKGNGNAPFFQMFQNLAPNQNPQ